MPRLALVILLTACVSHADPDYTVPPCKPGDVGNSPLSCTDVFEFLCEGNESATFTCSDAGAWQLTKVTKRRQ